MDISGYRSRSTPSLMQATTVVEARRRRGSASGRGSLQLPLKAKAALLLAVVALAWWGIRRAGQREAAAAAGQAVGAVEGVAGRGGAKQQRVQHLHSTRSGGAGSKPPRIIAQVADDVMTRRTERAMRLFPSYRGPGKAETLPFFGNANRVLLASHGRLMWYRYDTDELKVLHEGQGEHLYYGVFPGAERGVLGEPTTLWVVWAPFAGGGGEGGAAKQQQQQEWLLQLDAESGRELGRVEIPSSFTHDAVRRRDRVYLTSTAQGAVVELGFPTLEKLRELPLFTPEEHVNTLAPTADGKLWAVLHNLGSSELAEVSLETGQVLRRLRGIGEKAHGLVMWQQKLLSLDSQGGALVLVDPGSSTDGEAGAAAAVEKLWQVAERGKYLKGLCVVDDIAFFGIAPTMPRARRADPTLNCELAAFDLQRRVLLWRRQLPTRGLLNIVAAPHLTVESTTYAVQTRPLVSYRDKPAFAVALEASSKWAMQQEREAQGAHGAQAAAQQAQQAQQQEVPADQAEQRAQAGEQRAQAGEQQADGGQAHLEQAQQVQQAQREQQARQDEAQAQQAQAEEQQAQAQAQAQEQQAQAQEQQQQEHAQHANQAVQGEQDEQQHQQHHRRRTQEAQGQQAQQMQAGAAEDEGLGAFPVVRALSELMQPPPSDPLAKYPPHLDSVRWSSGLPRMMLSSSADGSTGGSSGLSGGVQLQLFRADVSPLKAQLARELTEADWGEEKQRASNAWFAGREDNLDQVKPGVASIMLLFSDGQGNTVFRLPWYDRFQAMLEPLLLRILGGKDMGNILRLQLARMEPRSRMRRHTDAGGYAERGHRIHVVLQSNPGISFHACESMQQHAKDAGGRPAAASPPCVPLHVEEGLVFEFNNRLPHNVVNSGDEARIHLLMDVAESPREPRQLRPGQLCHYAGGRISCEDAGTAGIAADGGHEGADEMR